MKGYPDWFPRFVIATMILLFATGVLLIPTTLEMRLELDVPWRLASSSRLAVVSGHVFVSFAILLIVGALWQLHMQAGLRKGRNVYSGLTMSTLLAVLTATGVGILYAGDETLSIAASMFHLLAGLAVAALFVFHVVKGRQQLRNG
jgi:hypothetical protein